MLHIIRYLLHKKPNKGGSVSSLTRASPAAAVDALDDLALLELGLGHAADAVGGEVGVARLDAAQAAEVLVALLLPLGDQVLVGDLVLHAVVVQLCNKWHKEFQNRKLHWLIMINKLGGAGDRFGDFLFANLPSKSGQNIISNTKFSRPSPQILKSIDK